MLVSGNTRWSAGRMAFSGVCAMAVVMVGRVFAQAPAAAANEDNENRIYIGRPDGSEMKPLVEMAEYRPQASPAWSSDGKLIALDAWRSARGEKNSDSKIIVVNADGSEPKVLGDGTIPSFSPQHKRIAFSRYAPNHGVWVMSSEGPEKELVLLDEEGWGASWSPDGRQIVYTVADRNAANLVVLDLVEGERISLFEEGKSPYRSFFWYFSWSPDGRSIAFKGQRIDSDKLEIGIVDGRGASHGLVTRFEGKNIYNVSWSHDSKRIFFTQPVTKLGNRMQLYSMDASTRDAPELLVGQDPERGNSAAAFSPDGKQLLIVSRKPPMNNNPAKEKAKTAKE